MPKTEAQALRILRWNWLFEKFGFVAWWEYEYHGDRLMKSEIHWHREPPKEQGE